MPDPGLDERVAHLEGRVHGFDGRFDRIERRIDGLEQRINALDAKFSGYFLWLVGLQVTVLITMLAGLLTR